MSKFFLRKKEEEGKMVEGGIRHPCKNMQNLIGAIFHLQEILYYFLSKQFFVGRSHKGRKSYIYTLCERADVLFFSCSPRREKSMPILNRKSIENEIS